MESRKVEFPGTTGAILAARLDLPPEPRAYALFAHCFTCGKDIYAASRIAEGLASRGIAVLRFDFTGIGSSEGEFANTNFSSNVADLVAAADYLRQHHGPPALLIGHSLGGAAVLAAAPRVPDATAVVTIGAPASAAHVTHNFAANLADIAEHGTAEVTLAGRSFTITKQFLDDLGRQTFLDNLADMKKALLVCHAPRDEYVGIDNASAIFTAARHPKSFLSLDTADHLLRKRSDATYVADVIATWVSRYLAAGEHPESLPDGVVEVTETRTGRFAQRVRTGRHVVAADEPVAVGGDDTGPGPYDYLLAALGACTSMTMRLYAERKGIAAERFSVRLSHRRVHAEDCADCETTEGNIGEITRDIAIAGDLTDAERARLIEIADKCPVHETLTHEIKIRSRLMPAG
ncbi:MAG TPA: bifunctional alpha/beta hydrolase/OsmC family protein [Acetobacteraceae bacterium]|nr:bifunctional alpha/beta hydrolase/OsmC family protein [Acetobacteraceae bacterium]